MNASSITEIKRSDLINLLVLDYKTTDEIGRVKQLWLELNAHQVSGLTCASGVLGRTKHSVTWEQIETIGTDSILVTIPEEEPEQPEGIVDSVAGWEIWTDAGNKAGKLADYCVNVETGAVVDYLFVSNGWQGITGSMYRLPPTAVISVGRKRIIVSDSTVQNAQKYGASLREKIHQASDLLKEDYAQTKENLTSAMEGTQELASQLKEKTHQVTNRAKEKLSNTNLPSKV
ncbi:MAG: PRC-barrel domain-containing protein [Xenococcaceae cyanobacterium]